MSGPNPEITVSGNLHVNPLTEEWGRLGVDADLAAMLASVEQAQRGLLAVVNLLTADEKLARAANTWAGWDYDSLHDATRSDLIHAVDVMGDELERRTKRLKKVAKAVAEVASE